MLRLNFNFNQLFIQAPGDFLYFASVMLIALGAWFMILSQSDERLTARDLRRAYIALAGLVLTWLAMFVAVVMAALSRQDAALYLPAIERAGISLVVLLLAWSFTTPRSMRLTRLSNLVVLLLMGLVVVAYLFTSFAWAALPTAIDFNVRYGIYWAVLLMFISGVGFVLMLSLMRWIEDAPLKALFFAVMLVANGLIVLQGELIGNYSGWQRIGFVVSLILMLVIVFRQLHQGTLVEETNVSPKIVSEPPVVRPAPALTSKISSQETQSVQLLKALGIILETPSPASIPEKIVQASLSMLKGDIGAILRVQDANYADVVYGFDRVMDRTIRALSLNLNQQATLANAVERRAQRGLFIDRNQEEIEDLYTRLDVEQRGPVYFQPLAHGEEVIAVLMIALPYAGYELDDFNLELLKGLAIVSAGLLQMSFEAQESRQLAAERAIQAMVEGVALSDMQDEGVITARQEMQASLKLARDQITELSRQVMQMKTKLDEERGRVLRLLGAEEDMSISQRIAAINTEQVNLLDERESLHQRLQSAEIALSGLTSNHPEFALRDIVESLNREKEALSAERDRLEERLKAFSQSSGSAPFDTNTLISEMMQERLWLEQERNQLKDKLNSLQQQLEGLGFQDGVIGLSQVISQLTEERDALKQRMESLIVEREALLGERSSLAYAIDRERERDNRLSMLLSQVENLASDREAALKQRDRLLKEYHELRDKLDAVKEHRARLLAQVSGLEMEIEELRELQGQPNAVVSRSAMDRELTVHTDVSKPATPPQAEMLVGLVQELRTPLTSIMGYIDLLLTESAGILGEMQRRFLQRVSANVSRLATMIADLVQMAQIDAGQYRLEPVAIHVVNVIEQVITTATIQLREKGITVNLDLDDDLPPLPADRDAFSQIMGQLLTNAYLVSPPNSEISIIARRKQFSIDESQTSAEVVYISVEDKGGGILPEDVARVFARKYKAENPLVQGLGDTGVGLSVARALVEAHGGQLWVSSKLGVGSTFNFVIPYQNGAS